MNHPLHEGIEARLVGEMPGKGQALAIMEKSQSHADKGFQELLPGMPGFIKTITEKI